MPGLLLLLLLLGTGAHGFPAPPETQGQDLELVQKYLENFYNLKNDGTSSRSQKHRNQMVDKLKQMQQFFGLKVTGWPDAATQKAMKQPRCGVPDVAAFGRTQGTPWWDHTNLTYRIKTYTPDLPRADVDQAIEKAFQLWSNVTPLTFTKVFEGEADIMISFVWGDHGDNSPFYESSLILAHAFSPGQGLGGDVHFDEKERWTKDYRNYNLYRVAAHEVGHSLGLSHSSDLGALMFPSYSYSDDPLLFQVDIDAIQDIYGPSENPVQPTGPQTPRACDSKLTFDTVMKYRGELYFVKDRFSIRTHPYNPQNDLIFISDFWPHLPSGLEAAYEVPERDEILFFKGSKYWAARGNDMLYEYPRDIYSSFGFPDTVKKIDAAVHEEETGKTYFFVGDKYWRYDENRQAMDADYPKKIVDSFPGIGEKVDAVFKNEGFFYFFHGKIQYEFDPKTERVLSLLNANSWFLC
ncbi:interstitial collagenase-like [Dasypus novemcinctus]|uniref:interstitial collagenase-like n=1 Tax=Dasypus novemcinctus TaxID=9361 RepID=UPI00265FFBF4|nr:interstitial collagenase-like [Dasypus novemcinctus]